jgi:hypothetical protein
VSEPVNLNKFRKAKTRAAKQQQAAENRVKYGRTKAEKARDRLEANKNKNAVDQSQRD